MASSRNYVKGRENLNDVITVNMLELRLVLGKASIVEIRLFFFFFFFVFVFFLLLLFFFCFCFLLLLLLLFWFVFVVFFFFSCKLIGLNK